MCGKEPVLLQRGQGVFPAGSRIRLSVKLLLRMYEDVLKEG